MKFGVVTFPGSNCDYDSVHVLRDVMGFETVELWHKDHDLQNVDFVMLPGGFSYGDYLRSGAVARFFNILLRECPGIVLLGAYFLLIPAALIWCSSFFRTLYKKKSEPPVSSQLRGSSIN